MPVLARYLLLQLPGLAMAGVALYVAWRWWGLPAKLAFGGFLFWVAKDLALYPFVRKAYALGPSELTGPEQLVGKLGVADDALDPQGYIRVSSELWRAESSEPVPHGASVRIRAVRGLTLQVEPVEDGNDGD